MIAARSFVMWLWKTHVPASMDGDHAGSDMRSFGSWAGEKHPEASYLLRLDRAAGVRLQKNVGSPASIRS